MANRESFGFKKRGAERGFSLMDLLTTIALTGIVSGIAIFNFRGINDPLSDGTKGIAGYLRNARVRAISTTSAYRIYPISATRVVGAYAKRCSDTTFTSDPKMIFDLPTGAELTDTSWSLCYSGRGLPSTNETIYLGNGTTVASVDVYLGGGIRSSI